MFLYEPKWLRGAETIGISEPISDASRGVDVPDCTSGVHVRGFYTSEVIFYERSLYAL